MRRELDSLAAERRKSVARAEGFCCRTPLLSQGGVAARSRRLRAATLASRRRARSASATARSMRSGWFKPRIIGGLNQPPRPLPQRWLRAIFLMSRPPLLGQGGELGNSPDDRGYELVEQETIRHPRPSAVARFFCRYAALAFFV